MSPTLNPWHGWTDLRQLAGWRLQQHQNGWLRIQDAGDRTTASAPALRDALAFWDATVDREQLHWRSDRFLVTLHGLSRTRRCLKPLSHAVSRHLRAEPINFEYASTKCPIAVHAQALDRVLRQLPADSHVDFAAHSMGNIVLRHWFGMLHEGRARAESLQLGRMVMLAPPNCGSKLACKLHNRWLFQRIAGPAGLQLGLDWQQCELDLQIPPIPFGIIAALVPRWLINPLHLEPGDWIVGLDETRLDDAADFMVVNALHATMMRSPQAIAATEHFLRHGTFRETVATM